MVITLARMGTIDPNRHPFLYDVSQNAHWVGTDKFPACPEWADEHEAWLRFVKDTGALDHYLPRLKGPKERCDEAFAEVAAAYFLVVKCGMRLLEWEPLGAKGKRGECLVGFDPSESMFVEVKAPGWEDESVKAEGQATPRLKQPKYIHAEARSTWPWAAVSHSVKKAYPKMPDTMPPLAASRGSPTPSRTSGSGTRRERRGRRRCEQSPNWMSFGRRTIAIPPSAQKIPRRPGVALMPRVRG